MSGGEGVSVFEQGVAEGGRVSVGVMEGGRGL